MRRLLPALALAVLAPLAAAAPAAAAPSYDLDLRLSRDGGTLSGTERIAFANETDAAMETVWLRLWAYGQSGCRARGVSIRVASGGTAVRRAAGCTALEVRLAQPLAPGASTELALRLRLRAPRTERRFGRSRGIFTYGNTIPVLSEGSPFTRYVELGESWVSRAGAWRAAIRVPRGLRVATTGSGPTRGGVMRVSTENARDFMVAASRRMRPVRGRAGGVRVTFWRTRTSPRRARSALRSAAVAVQRFGRAWGAYGGRELDVVDSNIAMEYPEVVLSPPVAFVVVHEVAHQWWWGIVGSDQHTSPWLDESLATYSEVRGEPGARFPARCRVPGPGALTRDMTYWRRHPREYGRDVYLGGACALVRLERAWGRSGLDAGLRLYVERHRFGLATPADLIAALRDAGAPAEALEQYRRTVIG